MEQGLILEQDKNRFVICPDVLGINGVMLVGRNKFISSHKGGLAPHNHGKSMEIAYLEKGRQVYYAAGNYHPVSGGDIFINFPEEVHGTGDYPEEKTAFCWMQIDLSVENEFLGLPEKFSLPLQDGLKNIEKRKFKGDVKLKKYCSEILGQAKGDSEFRILKMQQAAVAFLLEVLELEKKEEVEIAISQEIQQVLEYIHTNLEDNLDVSVLAKMCYLSQSHFRSLFKEQLGMPPQEYIMYLKIERAKEKLAAGGNVSEVSAFMGFSSPSYFSLQFKKYTAMSPFEYKKNIEEKRRKNKN